MEIDLEWCLICSQRVRDGSPYCSQQCRDQEKSSSSLPGLYSPLVTAPLGSCDPNESSSRNDGFFSLPTTSDDIACTSNAETPGLPITPLETPSPSSPTYPTLSFARRAYDQNPTPLPPLPPSVYSKRLSYEFWAQNEYKSTILNAPASSEKKSA